jgi:hypothetical protein
MATVSFQKMWEGFIGGGGTQTVYWNNAPSQRVWAFSAEAKDPVGDEFLPGAVHFTITSVKNELISAGNRRIRVDIMNTSGTGWTCVVYMTRIKA